MTLNYLVKCVHHHLFLMLLQQNLIYHFTFQEYGSGKLSPRDLALGVMDGATPLHFAAAAVSFTQVSTDII